MKRSRVRIPVPSSKEEVKMVVQEVAADSQFPENLNSGGTKLVIIDFSAKWLVIK